ncbi:Allantoinase [Hibiscus syriacus]|uniref:Allantoinase n=1 Tax=Hibiscus syriacus TaxID=106335 RepID=A0A6A3CXL6_HIBSY|nr:Allantoinase [Hibiscus syriacus]
MDLQKWNLFPLLALLASFIFLFYVQDSSKPSQSGCSLLPHGHYWIASKSIVTPQGIVSGAVILFYLFSGCLNGQWRHVHLDDPGRAEWEGFPSGTKAAAAGGITTLIDMPLNNFPSTVSAETLKLKIEAAEKSIYVDVGFWGGLVPENAFNATALEALLDAGALSLKSFMCPSGISDFPMTDSTHIKIQSAIENHLETEDDGGDPRSYSTYLKKRPPSMEEAAIRELLTVTKDTSIGGRAEGAHLHVVHLSDATEEIPDGDIRFKCAPPIRGAGNKEKLWNALMEGHIDMLSSDHSPPVPELKLLNDGNFLKAWGGMSLYRSFVLPVTWSYGQKFGITLEQLVSWWSEKPAKLARQHSKGSITIGNHADIVVWEPEVEFHLNEGHPMFVKNPSISAYIGKSLSGNVLATFVRGNLVYKEGSHALAACGSKILAA